MQCQCLRCKKYPDLVLWGAGWQWESDGDRIGSLRPRVWEWFWNCRYIEVLVCSRNWRHFVGCWFIWFCKGDVGIWISRPTHDEERVDFLDEVGVDGHILPTSMPKHIQVAQLAARPQGQ